MDFSGLITTFPTNRPLSEIEIAFNVKQKKRLNVVPHYQLSVIKMNSTYLETVDKWFCWKGMSSAVCATIIFILSSTLGLIAVEWILEGFGILSSTVESEILLANGFGMFAVTAVLIWAVTWLLRKESFAYTHYPIRFNRKTRTVHIFRTDGTVLTTPWDEIFFTMHNVSQRNEWEVRGHVLASDSTTVIETFALSYLATLSAANAVPEPVNASSADFVRAHWEFVRRYMEEGPQSVSSPVQFCMPVDGRRESFRVGLERIFANFASAPSVLYWMMFPFCLVVSSFRWIAMRTSKLPQWPQDIESACEVELNDPYAIQGGANGERVAVFPEAAQAAGVHFYAPSDLSKTRGSFASPS